MSEQASLPRSSSEILADQHLSRKQQQVLEGLQNFPDGACAADVAEKLGMHVNTVRSHLEELVAQGAVRSMPAPIQGRGRPAIIYHTRVPSQEDLNREYVGLVHLLIKAAVKNRNLSEDTVREAQEMGREWARSTGAQRGGVTSPDEVVGLLFGKLRDFGFDPNVIEGEDGYTFDLHACPFSSQGVSPSPLVCAIHDGYLRELCAPEPDNALQLKVIPASGPGTCSVRISR